MKFGGTSLGTPSSIEKAVAIVRRASRENSVVVVVSAMSGVTNKLVEVAKQSEAGSRERVAAIFEELKERHDAAVKTLIHSPSERSRIHGKMEQLFERCEQICQSTILLRELTLRARDSICSLGERLSAPLVAAVLSERGVASEAMEATEIVVTDSCYGAAKPQMDETRERCEARLRPLLQQEIVPVVTGFIGATRDGVLTTLGRNSSDYSATILAAALDVDEVIMWTDVDGVLTADPRLVPGACTIPEISYREAAELAYFGAKVLHPKTLQPVMQLAIPLWVRNTFSPEHPGTKIVAGELPRDGGVKALASMNGALITLDGIGIRSGSNVLDRILATTADVLLISQSSSQNKACLVVSSALAERAVEALHREFNQGQETVGINLNPSVAVITVVGQNMHSMPGMVKDALGALHRNNVAVIAVAQGSSELNVSIVVAQKDAELALVTVHRKFQLGVVDSPALRVSNA